MKSNLVHLPQRNCPTSPVRSHAPGIIVPIESRVESVLSRRRIIPAPAGAWFASPDNSSVTLSESWADAFGPETLALVRRNWMSMVHPDDRFDAAMRWLKGRRSGRPYGGVSRCLVYGTYWPVQMYSFPVFNSSGEIMDWEGYNQPWVMGRAANF